MASNSLLYIIFEDDEFEYLVLKNRIDKLKSTILTLLNEKITINAVASCGQYEVYESTNFTLN